MQQVSEILFQSYHSLRDPVVTLHLPRTLELLRAGPCCVHRCLLAAHCRAQHVVSSQ